MEFQDLGWCANSPVTHLASVLYKNGNKKTHESLSWRSHFCTRLLFVKLPTFWGRLKLSWHYEPSLPLSACSYTTNSPPTKYKWRETTRDVDHVSLTVSKFYHKGIGFQHNYRLRNAKLISDDIMKMCSRYLRYNDLHCKNRLLC